MKIDSYDLPFLYKTVPYCVSAADIAPDLELLVQDMTNSDDEDDQYSNEERDDLSLLLSWWKMEYSNPKILLFSCG